MEKSQSITNLSKALFTFHKEMGKIAKTSNNPFFKSKYADLPTILDAISKPLDDAGLVVVSIPDGEGLTTILLHAESGEYISANGIMKPVKNDPQAIGSAITYQRRYSIGSILNLNIDEDDDGNKASGKQETKQQQKSQQAQQPKPKGILTLNNQQYGVLVKWLAETPGATINAIKAKWEMSEEVENALKDDAMEYQTNLKNK